MTYMSALLDLVEPDAPTHAPPTLRLPPQQHKAPPCAGGQHAIPWPSNQSRLPEPDDSGRHRIGRARIYSSAEHMPVLMSRDLLFEMEARWPIDFERTRRNKLRHGQELELNFLYHHYLRVQHFPLVAAGASRIALTRVKSCACMPGRHTRAVRVCPAEEYCAQDLKSPLTDFIAFNDDDSDQALFDAGLVSLLGRLKARFGSLV